MDEKGTTKDFSAEKYRADIIKYIYGIKRLDRLKVVYTFARRFSKQI